MALLVGFNGFLRGFQTVFLQPQPIQITEKVETGLVFDYKRTFSEGTERDPRIKAEPLDHMLSQHAKTGHLHGPEPLESQKQGQKNEDRPRETVEDIAE